MEIMNLLKISHYGIFIFLRLVCGQFKIGSDLHVFVHGQQRLQTIVLLDVARQSPETVQTPFCTVHSDAPSDTPQTETNTILL